MGIGPSIFFPLTAVQSVPFLIIAICLAIRGYMVAPELKEHYKKLLIFYGIFVAVFFFPTINYSWMSPETPYDMLYHSAGFISSIAIFIYALTDASRNTIKWRGLLPLVYFGCWFFQLLTIPVPGGSSGFFGSPSMETRIVYAIYATLQIAIPLFALSTFVNKKDQLITERKALMYSKAQQYYQQIPSYEQNPYWQQTHQNNQQQPPQTDKMI